MPLPIPQTPKKKKRKALGPAVILPESDDVEIAQPDQRDKSRAGALILVSGLLAAIWAGRVIWNVSKQQFVNPNGGFISEKQLRAEWEKVITESRIATRAFAQELIDGQRSLAEWQFAMRDEIKALHYVTWSLGEGGPQHVSPADEKVLAEVIQTQVEYLNKRAAYVESGAQKVDGTLRTTSGLYANAGRSTYFASVTHGARNRRIKYVERVLNPGESCEDCIAWAGFWDLDSCPEIGSSRCGPNCNCSIEPIEELGVGEELHAVE